MWCNFLNSLKCFSESFNASGSLYCTPRTITDPEKGALDFTHTGSTAASPTGVTPRSYQESAGDRKSLQIFSIPEAGPAAPGEGDCHAERKGRLEPEGWFLFLQVPDSAGETQEREDKNRVSSTGDQ